MIAFPVQTTKTAATVGATSQLSYEKTWLFQLDYTEVRAGRRRQASENVLGEWPIPRVFWSLETPQIARVQKRAAVTMFDSNQEPIAVPDVENRCFWEDYIFFVSWPSQALEHARNSASDMPEHFFFWLAQRAVRTTSNAILPATSLERTKDAASRLIEQDCEPEPLMAELQRILREGDRDSANYLYRVLQDEKVPGPGRALILETVAAARADGLNDRTESAIRQALRDKDEDVRFAAVAAASDLPAAYRHKLTSDVEPLGSAQEPSSDVRREAKAFLILATRIQ